MAVAVTRDLTVQVLEDVNAVKLTERQQALRAAIQKGEPKCLGVSQVMLGLMVMSYSIPLHFTEVTEVVSLGVAWWSGLTFIAAGVVAIILDKNSTMKMLQVCLIVSVVSTLLSAVSLIIYFVDMFKNPEDPCNKTQHGDCSNKYYAMEFGIRGAKAPEQSVTLEQVMEAGMGLAMEAFKLSRGVKSSLLVFTVVQAVISAVLCFSLFRQRRSFGQYTSLTEAAPSNPTTLIPPDQN